MSTLPELAARLAQWADQNGYSEKSEVFAIAAELMQQPQSVNAQMLDALRASLIEHIGTHEGQMRCRAYYSTGWTPCLLRLRSHHRKEHRMNSSTDPSKEETRCPNCHGIHWGSSQCPFTAEEGAMWRGSTAPPNVATASTSPAQPSLPVEAAGLIVDCVLCPPHQKVAAKLADYPSGYGCPQCARNRTCELEEITSELLTCLRVLVILEQSDPNGCRNDECRRLLNRCASAIEAADLFSASDMPGGCLNETGDAVPAPPTDTAQKIDFHNSGDGEFDETWFRSCHVHIERMNETGFWIGFDMPGDVRVMLNTGVHKGVWFFNLEEDKVGDHQFASVQRPRSSKPIPVTKPPADTREPSPEEMLKGADDLEAIAEGIRDIVAGRVTPFDPDAETGIDVTASEPAHTATECELCRFGICSVHQPTIAKSATVQTGKPGEPVREGTKL